MWIWSSSTDVRKAGSICLQQSLLAVVFVGTALGTAGWTLAACLIENLSSAQDRQEPELIALLSISCCTACYSSTGWSLQATNKPGWNMTLFEHLHTCPRCSTYSMCFMCLYMCTACGISSRLQNWGCHERSTSACPKSNQTHGHRKSELLWRCKVCWHDKSPGYYLCLAKISAIIQLPACPHKLMGEGVSPGLPVGLTLAK